MSTEILNFTVGAATGLSLLLACNAAILEQWLRSELFTYAGVLGLGASYWGQFDLHDPAWQRGCIFGVACAVIWMRFGVPWIEQATDELIKRSRIMLGQHTDMRVLAERISRNSVSYDPRRFFQADSVFVGVDQAGKAFHLPMTALRHLMVMGTTGGGKGQLLQSLSAQLLNQKESVFYLDPKADEFAPHVLFDAAARAGVGYQFLDLGVDQPPQINVLEGASQREVIQLLESTFQLQDRGKPSDFYLAGDREGVRELAALIVEHGLTCREAFLRIADDKAFAEQAANLRSRLKALAEVSAINAQRSAIDLAHVIESGGAVYVQGALEEEATKAAMRMLFVRLIQLASRRDRLAGALRQVNIIADELRFQISGPVLTALSTARDKGVRLLLACQSLADIRASETSMDKDALAGIVIENTPLKLTYRIEDPDTAELLARKSGTVRVMEEVRETRLNMVLTETLGKRSLRESEGYRVEPNTFLSLPRGWGVLMYGGEVQVLHISPLPVIKTHKAIAITTSECSEAQTPLPVADGGCFDLGDLDE